MTTGVYDLFHFGCVLSVLLSPVPDVASRDLWRLLFSLTSRTARFAVISILVHELILGDCRHALQLRQAKLSFPEVHLIVGVNSDELVKQHKANTIMRHAERYVHLPLSLPFLSYRSPSPLPRTSFHPPNHLHCYLLETNISSCEAVRHCRWVDQVVPEAPWILDAEFLEKYQIDYIAHDDDPYVTAGHDDAYAFVKSQGSSLVAHHSFAFP